MCIALPAMIAVVHGPCRSKAWVIAPPRHNTAALPAGAFEKAGQRCTDDEYHHRRRQSCPFSVSRSSEITTAAAAAAAVPPPVDDGEGVETTAGEEIVISPPAPPPLEEAAGGMTSSSGGASKAGPSRGASWKEQFASLRNDVTDPWSAKSHDDDADNADGVSNDGNAPATSPAIPLTKNDVVAACGEEEVQGIESSPTTPTHSTKKRGMYSYASCALDGLTH